MGPGEIRVQRDRLVEGGECYVGVGGVHFVFQGDAAQVGIEGLRVVGAADAHAGHVAVQQGDFQRGGDVGGDVGFQMKHVAGGAVVGVRPDGEAGAGVDQVGGDADGVAGWAAGALEHGGDVQLAADIADVRRAGAEREAGGSGGDPVLHHAAGDGPA